MHKSRNRLDGFCFFLPAFRLKRQSEMSVRAMQQPNVHDKNLTLHGFGSRNER